MQSEQISVGDLLCGFMGISVTTSQILCDAADNRIISKISD